MISENIFLTLYYYNICISLLYFLSTLCKVSSDSLLHLNFAVPRAVFFHQTLLAMIIILAVPCAAALFHQIFCMHLFRVVPLFSLFQQTHFPLYSAYAPRHAIYVQQCTYCSVLNTFL